MLIVQDMVAKEIIASVEDILTKEDTAEVKREEVEHVVKLNNDMAAGSDELAAERWTSTGND